MKNLIQLFSLAGILVGTFTATHATELSQQSRPNIIIVITDDQGYGDLGVHGNPIVETPNLDQFHSESVRLTNYHVDPTCAPTRAALMTGRYSGRVGVWHTVQGRSMLRTREVTMADVLKDNGYATGLFGKWHLGDSYPFRPEDRGFTTSVYHGAGGVGQTPDYWSNDYFDDIYSFNGIWKQTEGFCTDVFFGEAKKFIRENKDRPFFAYITTNAPHGPFRAPKEYFEKYINHPLLKDYETPKNTWAKRTKVEMASFYGMITNIDDNFAALRQLLKEEGIEENTILVFTTDNGSSAGTPIHNAGMRGGKGSRYDGGHRVPWFMSWPAGDIGGGTDIDLLTAHMDILPTLIDLLDLEAPEIAFDGSSLKDVLHGKPQSNLENRTLVLENQRIKDPIKWRGTAVMRGMWRYTLTGEKEELYNLESDPGQRKNILAQHPEMAQSLIAEYEKFWADVSQEHHLFSRPEVGSPHSNPVRLTSHDHITEGAILPAWHQEYHIYPGTPRHDAPWSIEFVEDGSYEISIRRWPAEQDFVINYHPEPEGAFSAVKAYLELNDIRMEMEVPAGAKEVTFSVEIEAGPASLNTGFIEEGGERVSAYYAYLLNTEINGAPEGWQSREGLGLRQIDWAGAPEWEQIESQAYGGK
jgi:arylsulfatase A-like enzyme